MHSQFIKSKASVLLTLFVALISNGISRAQQVTYEGIVYTIDNNNAVVTGLEDPLYQGALTIAPVINYNGINYPVTSTSYRSLSGGQFTSITVPSSVTSIGMMTFASCKELKSVTLNEGLRSLGSSAFSNCQSLESIIIPNSVTTFDGWTFAYCHSLKSVTLSNSLIVMGYHEFEKCYALETVDLPATLIRIGEAAFLGCTSLKNINVASGNQYFQSVDGILFDYNLTKLIAFPAASNIASYNIPNSVTSIERYACYQNKNLVDITLGNSVEKIGSNAFYQNESLKTVNFNNGLTTIESVAFEYCNSLEKVNLPASLSSLGSSTFSYCGSLQEINVDSGNASFTSVDGVLYNDDITKLLIFPGGKATVDIPATVETISYYCFNGASTIETLSIPANVLTIEDQALNYMTNLHEIIVDEDNPNYASLDGILYDKAFENLCQFPCGRNNVVIPNSVIKIGYGAFAGSKIIQVVIPENVTTLGVFAFQDCLDLENIIIKGPVKSMEDGVFTHCVNIRRLVLGENVSSIEGGNFSECVNLGTIYSYNPIPPKSHSGLFADNVYQSCSLYLPASAIDDYTSLNYSAWMYFQNVYPIGSENISDKYVTNPEPGEYTNIDWESINIEWQDNLIIQSLDLDKDVTLNGETLQYKTDMYISEQDNAFIIDFANREVGSYTLLIPEGYMSLSDNFINSEITLDFTVVENTPDDAGSVSSLEDEADGSYDIYSLKGYHLSKTKDGSEVLSLPSGIYIINGKKVIIRK